MQIGARQLCRQLLERRRANPFDDPASVIHWGQILYFNIVRMLKYKI
jgi:hypothetical protein